MSKISYFYSLKHARHYAALNREIGREDLIRRCFARLDDGAIVEYTNASTDGRNGCSKSFDDYRYLGRGRFSHFDGAY